MAKVMLVEDDNNLREIYGARLLAEGYEIVSAKDGEEALAMAVKEKPDLIISDIMMPKISGFDMLDILRSTPETKNTKVIMMTALSQAEDKERAGKLGADRYLVKSQVTLEDVAKAAAEVLASDATTAGSVPAPAAPEPVIAAPVAPTPALVTPAPEPAPAPVPEPTATPVVPAAPAAPTPTSIPVTTPEPSTAPVAPVAPVAVPTPIPVTEAPATPAAPVAPTPAPAVAAPAPAAPAAASNAQVLADAAAAVSGTPATAAPETPKTSVHTKVIKPINDLTATPPDLNKLLAAEEAKGQVNGPVPTPIATESTGPKPEEGTNISIATDGSIQSS